MTKSVSTIEDCLELLIGMREHSAFRIESSDHTLLYSMARQVARGTPLTDRQYELSKEKIMQYKDQFTALNLDVEELQQNLRMPLRSIDRSRWIRLDEYNGHSVIAVRFVFQKKLLAQLETVKRNLTEEHYDKEQKIHYFALNEHSVHVLISNFSEDKGFDIDPVLKDYYKKLEDMNNNKENYLPGIYSLKLKNLHEKNVDYALSSIGEPTEDNLFQFYDQRERFGLHHFDQPAVEASLRHLTVLSKKIINRSMPQVLISPKEYTLENLAESIFELYRFPLLIVLDEKTCYDELVGFHRVFDGIISNDQCSVMFRLDNIKGAEFNNYVREQGLNSPVDTNTKIVYINNDKLPKPLLKSNWMPLTAITTQSNYRGSSSKVDVYLDSLDLVIHYDSEASPWRRRSIEKI